MATAWPVIMCFCAHESSVYMQRSWSQPFAQCVDIFSVECLWFIVSASYALSRECSVNTAGTASSCVSLCVCFWANPGHAQWEATSWWSWCLSAADRPDTTYKPACSSHTQTKWYVAKVPEEQDFPAMQYEPLSINFIVRAIWTCSINTPQTTAWNTMNKENYLGIGTKTWYYTAPGAKD